MEKYKCLIGTVALTKGKYYWGKIVSKRKHIYEWPTNKVRVTNDNGNYSYVQPSKMLRIR